MYYILFYTTADDYMERRGQFRQQHLEMAKERVAKGEIVMGGALADPPDQAIIVFKGESPEVAEEFARNDPYVLNGVVTSWEVRPWTVVIGE
jgi:uncharacterized protein YciI